MWKIEQPDEFLCTDNHYLINGKKYYRVTRINSIIAKPELMSWYAKQGMDKAKKILKSRACFGSTLHKCIEVILKNKELHYENYDPLLINDLKLFEQWKNENNIKIEALEQHLWSDEFLYAGTADFIGKLNGKRLIGDWKTSKAIYDEYWLQLSAYFFAFEELTDEKLDGAFILKIRDGKKELQYKTRNELKDLFEVFKAAYIVFKWKYGEK